jgi:hypothetical protein
MGRVTRSSTRKEAEPPAKKDEEVKAKPPAKEKKVAAPKKKAEPAPKKESPKKPTAAAAKKAEAAAKKAGKGKKGEEAAEEEKKVEIEASKEWGAFKTRAEKIAKAVGGKAVVEINKEKVSNAFEWTITRVNQSNPRRCSPIVLHLVWQPGKGNFIVRVSGVEAPIVELKAMSRPFPPLKALDMEEVSRQVLAALAT